MPDTFFVRSATPADARVLADHRVSMFRDMGTIRAEFEAALRDASFEYFTRALAIGEYVAWVACLPDNPTEVVGGGGVQLRSLLPRPEPSGSGLLVGHEGLILNVYVEASWRRRGVARRLMTAILEWAGPAGVARLVLHASPDGRPLYESLGFIPTNEMRYAGTLGHSR